MGWEVPLEGIEKNQEGGFTLIELVLVVVLLGLMAISALPSFIDVSTEAANSAKDGVVGAIRDGIKIYKTNSLIKQGPPGVYPTTLDSASNSVASPSNRLFTTVLNPSVDNSSWTRNSNTTYTYSKHSVFSVYYYSPSAGTFLQQSGATPENNGQGNCQNSADDDLDGLTDCLDPSCSGEPACS